MNTHRSSLSVLGLGLWLALGPLPAVAADEGIGTDRPDFVESSDVLTRGRFQLETGVNHEQDRADGIRSRGWSTPTLLRYGIGHELELRFESDGLIGNRVTDLASGTTLRQRGTADAALGVKWHAGDGNAQLGTPSTAWLLHVDLDSGSSPFRGQGIRPSVRYVAEWELADSWSVGVMPGAARDSDNDGRHFVAGILAATASRDLREDLRGFFEIAGQRLASKRRGGNVVTLDSGLTLALGRDAQIDVSLNRGLTRYTPDWTFGLGWSARY